MNFLKENIFFWDKLNVLKKKEILLRPEFFKKNILKENIKKVIYDVKKNGDKALYFYTKKFDKKKIKSFFVSKKIIKNSFLQVHKDIKKSVLIASKNIEYFHLSQSMNSIDVITDIGIRCQQLIKPINKVGLYIPGGSSPLLSTVLMLSIPAYLAKCKKIVLCSPPPISNELLYVASYICGVDNIFQIGGSQAIAAMAFGTESIPKVDKIFGPGNLYVTEAKKQVNKSFNFTDIDMLAGPSEVVVIADKQSNPDFVASDLLSQAEHGKDSQVLLLTNSKILVDLVLLSIKKQLNKLSRKEIIKKSLKNSYFIITKNIEDCLKISNIYAPEHLIIQCKKARSLLSKIVNAGSVFLGPWSPESVGDYASGINHVLPTYGNVKTFSGLSLVDFQKRIMVQELTKNGLKKISSTIKILSTFEKLDAHYKAVSIRLNSI